MARLDIQEGLETLLGNFHSAVQLGAGNMVQLTNRYWLDAGIPCRNPSGYVVQVKVSYQSINPVSKVQL